MGENATQSTLHSPIFHIPVGNPQDACNSRFRINAGNHKANPPPPPPAPLKSIKEMPGILRPEMRTIALIHDTRHVGFQIVMQISHVLCWGVGRQTLE